MRIILIKFRFRGRSTPWLRPRPSNTPITAKSTAFQDFEVSDIYAEFETTVLVFRGILFLVLYSVCNKV